MGNVNFGGARSFFKTAAVNSFNAAGHDFTVVIKY